MYLVVKSPGECLMDRMDLMDRPSGKGTPRAFELVARKIGATIRARYEIGQRLPGERELARLFGVSRPTIREAVLFLSLAGMVEVRTNSGVYVTGRHQPTRREVVEGFGPFEMLFARRLIEPEVAALAAKQATASTVEQLADAMAMMRHENAMGRESEAGDHRFHVILAEATGNGMLVAVSDMLWSGQTKSRIWDEIYRRTPAAELWPLWLEGHERIFQAIRKKDPQQAKAAMIRHLDNIHDTFMAYSNPPDDGATKRSKRKPRELLSKSK
jgi:GntR family uxuAB operon transcriptional repressor